MKRLFYLLFCLVVMSCQSQSERAPANLIPKEKMVRILADIHTTEALIENQVTYPDTALMVFNQKQTEIFELHGVTEEQFEETYNYYLKDLTAMNALYETIVDTLSLRESKADTVKRDEIEGPVPPEFKYQQ